MKVTREPGFYWVRIYKGSPWTVGEWTSDTGWIVPGDDDMWEDEAFAEIDERRIVREDTAG